MTKTRKELIDEYKQTKIPMGVFQIRNLVNGKVFISSSPNLNAIWNSQKFRLEFKSHPNPNLQEEWNTFGAENFVFEILHELKPREDSVVDPRVELKELEKMTVEEARNSKELY